MLIAPLLAEVFIFIWGMDEFAPARAWKFLNILPNGIVSEFPQPFWLPPSPVSIFPEARFADSAKLEGCTLAKD